MGTCISADDWLGKNPKNYISFYFGVTYDGTDDFSTDPTELCFLYYLFKGNVKDSIILDKKICDCPADDAHKYLVEIYENAETNTICTDSSKSNKGDLEAQITFQLKGKDHTLYMILNSEVCKYYGGHATADSKCVATCPEDTPVPNSDNICSTCKEVN